MKLYWKRTNIIAVNVAGDNRSFDLRIHKLVVTTSSLATSYD